MAATRYYELDPYDPETDLAPADEVVTVYDHEDWPKPKKGSIQTPTPNASALLGIELLPLTDWTATGWTGDFSVGFTHTAGNTTALSQTLAAIVANNYQVSVIVTGRTAGTFTVGFGGDTTTAMFATVTYNVLASTNANLVITPSTDFDGTIKISVTQITWSLSGSDILALLGKSSLYGQTEINALLALRVLGVTDKSLLADTEISRLLTIPAPYTITLQAGADLATKIANSTETTHYPTGWVLAAVDGVNLSITHGLAKRFTGISVFGKVGAVETLLRPWSEAYTNVIAETTSILKIYGIDPVNEITIIDLTFKA